MKDIVAGIIKSVFFGLIMGLVACYRGLTVKGGAAGVGDRDDLKRGHARSRAVIAADTLFNMILVQVYD